MVLGLGTFVFAALASTLVSAVPAPEAAADPVLITPSHPLLHLNGRWDQNWGSWWQGTGFKLNVVGLTSLTLNLGPASAYPSTTLGISVDYEPFRSVEVSAGANVLPLLPSTSAAKSSVVRVHVKPWTGNRIQLESITLNPGAKLLPFQPSKLVFEFIGDSLTTGYFIPEGVDGAYAGIVGEEFKAELTAIAQPGACLTDQLCYGNPHGMSYLYFKTEDSGYYYSTDHNYTTDWDFRRDKPKPTHVFLNIGTNDNSHSIPADTVVENYLTWLTHLRQLYPTQHIFVIAPWGWPSEGGYISPIYPGRYADVVNARKALGDTKIHLIDTAGWVTYDDIFHDNYHPSVEGHQKVARLLSEWLQAWGLSPLQSWPGQRQA